VGQRARRHIDASGGMKTGRGMATAGIIISIVNLCVFVLVVVLFLVVAATNTSSSGSSSLGLALVAPALR